MTLYAYYQKQQFNPTFCRFQSMEDLNNFIIEREELFTYKLKLPTVFFQNRTLAEFGPSSGENSLAFARWGAHLTLIEPVKDYHQQIREYFKRYELNHTMDDIIESDLLSFLPEKQFDFIDVEGFIYTILPTSKWLQKLSQITKPGGFAVVSYMGLLGMFFELLLQLVHKQYKQKFNLDPVAAAEKLFSAKWDSIPHNRSFESWLYDVIANPYLRAKYFIEASEYCQLFSQYGFRLYSSFPNYQEYGNVYWHRKKLPAEEIAAQTQSFIKRNALSYFLGGRLELWSASKEEAEEIHQKCLNFVYQVDDLIEEFSTERCLKIDKDLKELNQIIEKTSFHWEKESDRLRALEIIESTKQIFQLLKQEDYEALVQFCNTDKTFIGNWGTPTHYTVLRKEDEESACQ